MKRLTKAEIVEINKSIGEGGVEINSNLHGIIYALDETANVEDYATLLLTELISLHPFLQGNKRTAFYSLVMFLRKNGYALKKEYGYNDKIDRILISVIRGRSRNHTKQLLKKMIYHGKPK